MGKHSRLGKQVTPTYSYVQAILLTSIFELRQQSSTPMFRGRKLVLNYTNGSPCEQQSQSSRVKAGSNESNDREKKRKTHHEEPVRRKSTLISLLCDRDVITPRVAISFVGASPDHCAYFFEARSTSACGGISKEAATMSPGGVFGVM